MPPAQLVTASADGTARVYNTMSGACQSILIGHEGEISKVCEPRLTALAPCFVLSRMPSERRDRCVTRVLSAPRCQVCFNPQGTRILTASSDKTAQIWDVDTGDCLQVLEGHTDEIFSCAFNYEGETIITGSFPGPCCRRVSS